MGLQLIVSDEVRAKVDAAIVKARSNPVDYTDPERIKQHAFPDQGVNVYALEDRASEFRRPGEVMDFKLPGDVIVALSYEKQPVGLVQHLSVSIDIPGKVPSDLAVMEVMKLFRMPRADRAWAEEYEPGRVAFNVIYLEEPDDGALKAPH